jgi:hypothetical protein
MLKIGNSIQIYFNHCSLLDPLMSQYSVIMLDEAYERNVNTDVLFWLLKKVVQKRKYFTLIVHLMLKNSQHIFLTVISSEYGEELFLLISSTLLNLSQTILKAHFRLLCKFISMSHPETYYFFSQDKKKLTTCAKHFTKEWKKYLNALNLLFFLCTPHCLKNIRKESFYQHMKEKEKLLLPPISLNQTSP